MNKKITILIVEDEIITAFHIQKVMEKLGYHTLKPVYSAENAILIAQQARPNVILMDIGLAGNLNGIEAAKKILSIYEPIIIFTTGYVHDEVMEEANEINHAGYFLKPLDFSEIQQAIKSACNSKP